MKLTMCKYLESPDLPESPDLIMSKAPRVHKDPRATREPGALGAHRAQGFWAPKDLEDPSSWSAQETDT